MPEDQKTPVKSVPRGKSTPPTYGGKGTPPGKGETYTVLPTSVVEQALRESEKKKNMSKEYAEKIAKLDAQIRETLGIDEVSYQSWIDGKLPSSQLPKVAQYAEPTGIKEFSEKTGIANKTFEELQIELENKINEITEVERDEREWRDTDLRPKKHVEIKSTPESKPIVENLDDTLLKEILDKYPSEEEGVAPKIPVEIVEYRDELTRRKVALKEFEDTVLKQYNQKYFAPGAVNVEQGGQAVINHYHQMERDGLPPDMQFRALQIFKEGLDDSSKRTVDQISTIYEEMNQERKAKEEEIKGLVVEVERLKGQAENDAKEKEALIEAENRMKTEKDALGEKCKGYETQINKQNTEISGLNGQLDEKDKRITELNERVTKAAQRNAFRRELYLHVPPSKHADIYEDILFAAENEMDRAEVKRYAQKIIDYGKGIRGFVGVTRGAAKCVQKLVDSGALDFPVFKDEPKEVPPPEDEENERQ